MQECLVLHLRLQAKRSTAALRVDSELQRSQRSIQGPWAERAWLTERQRTANHSFLPGSIAPALSLHHAHKRVVSGATAQHDEVHLFLTDSVSV